MVAFDLIRLYLNIVLTTDQFNIFIYNSFFCSQIELKVFKMFFSTSFLSTRSGSVFDLGFHHKLDSGVR